MRAVVLALVASVLTALYWWVVFLAVYANVLFAGDRNPSAPPVSDSAQITHATLLLIAGTVVSAVLVLLWRRLAGLRGRP